jgi:hypothetical protein
VRLRRPNLLPRATVVAAALLSVMVVNRARVARETRVQMAAWDVAFKEEMAALPMHAGVIFVHYAPGLRPHANIVLDSPHLDEEPFWIVNDLGARNRELMRFAGPRIPLAFYEDGGKFEVDRSLLRPP